MTKHPMTPEGILEISIEYGSSEIDPLTMEIVVDSILLRPYTHDMFVWLKNDFSEMIKPTFGRLYYSNNPDDSYFKMRYVSMESQEAFNRENELFQKALMEYHRDKSGNFGKSEDSDERNTKSK